MQVDRLGPERALMIEYEEMHQDMPGQLRKLATLLGVRNTLGTH
jgi:hypothetical protein